MVFEFTPGKFIFDVEDYRVRVLGKEELMAHTLRGEVSPGVCVDCAIHNETFVSGIGTVRKCRMCGVPVIGGPTSCRRCVTKSLRLEKT